MLGRTLIVTTAVAAVVACGGSQPRMEPEPPWVSEYQRIATDGCACQDDPDCVDAAHTAAVKMEDEHGGIDAMPPSVQEAHGELDTCWREGTRDLGRDVTEAADQVCRCTETSCVDKYRLGLVQLEDKYRVNLTDPAGLEPGPREQLTRANTCIEGFTIPAHEYLDAMRGVADRLCKCDGFDCWAEAMSAKAPSYGGRYYIADMASIRSELDIATNRYCDCFHAVPEKVIKDKLGRPLIVSSVHAEMHCGS